MAKIVFVVYFTGSGSPGLNTLAGFTQACAELLPHVDHEVQAVNILKHPAQVEAARILATPTIIRTAPLPQKRIIGDTGEPERARRAVRFLIDDLNLTNHGK